MNEVSAEQLLMIIGEQAVEIKILRMEIMRLKQQYESTDKENNK